MFGLKFGRKLSLKLKFCLLVFKLSVKPICVVILFLYIIYIISRVLFTAGQHGYVPLGRHLVLKQSSQLKL